MANLLVAMLQTLDVPADQFGDSTGIVSCSGVACPTSRLAAARGQRKPS